MPQLGPEVGQKLEDALASSEDQDISKAALEALSEPYDVELARASRTGTVFANAEITTATQSKLLRILVKDSGLAYIVQEGSGQYVL